MVERQRRVAKADHQGGIPAEAQQPVAKLHPAGVRQSGHHQWNLTPQSFRKSTLHRLMIARVRLC